MTYTGHIQRGLQVYFIPRLLACDVLSNDSYSESEQSAWHRVHALFDACVAEHA